MRTNLNIIDSIVVLKGAKSYYAKLRFKDRFYDRDLAHPDYAVIHDQIDSYLYKNLGIKTR